VINRAYRYYYHNTGHYSYPLLCLKYNVSEIGFYLGLQLELLFWAQQIELVPVSGDRY
jgi:hypothetical protein